MSFYLDDLAFDPDLSEDVTIIRYTGSFVAGVWTNSKVDRIPTSGAITVADDKAIRQVPEGDRVEGAIQLLCAQPIYPSEANRPGNTAGISDEVEWDASKYRVHKVAPWGKYGFWSAILTRMKGA